MGRRSSAGLPLKSCRSCIDSLALTLGPVEPLPPANSFRRFPNGSSLSQLRASASLRLGFKGQLNLRQVVDCVRTLALVHQIRILRLNLVTALVSSRSEQSCQPTAQSPYPIMKTLNSCAAQTPCPRVENFRRGPHWSLAVFLLVLLGSAKASLATELSVAIIGNYPAVPTYEVNYFTDNDLSTDYASSGGGAATYVDFQFAGAVTIGSAVYTDRTSSGFFNGSYWAGPYDNVTSYKLIFSDEPTFSSVLWEQEYASPGFANTDPAALVNGGYGVTAQYVRWQVTATDGGNPGGAEIHFFTPEIVPEPSIGALCCLGVCLFARCRGRRQMRH